MLSQIYQAVLDIGSTILGLLSALGDFLITDAGVFLTEGWSYVFQNWSNQTLVVSLMNGNPLYTILHGFISLAVTLCESLGFTDIPLWACVIVTSFIITLILSLIGGIAKLFPET